MGTLLLPAGLRALSREVGTFCGLDLLAGKSSSSEDDSDDEEDETVAGCGGLRNFGLAERWVLFELCGVSRP